MLRKDLVPILAAISTGIVVNLYITNLTGRKESWDSALYFSIGIPIMCGVIAVLSFFFPERNWRWTAAMTVGQVIAMAANSDGSWSLWPLGLIAFTIVSLPQFLVGIVVGKLSRRFRK